MVVPSATSIASRPLPTIAGTHRLTSPVISPAAPIAAGNHRTVRTRRASTHVHSRLAPIPSAAATGTSRTSPRVVPDAGPWGATSKVGRPREYNQETSVAMMHTGTATTAPRRRIPVTMTSSTA